MKRIWLTAWLSLAAAGIAQADAPAEKAAAPKTGTEQTAPAVVAKDETPKFTYGGSADFYYLANFNDPFNDRNFIRAFDTDDGGNLGLIDIWAQYARDPIGFRIDLNWGPTATPANVLDNTGTKFWKHVQQLYVGMNLNKAGTDYVEFGRWVSTAGLEVIEPKDNWLYSRGMLFNWAVPFYHVGARFYHYTNDTDYVMGAIHRGWNAVSSPGHSPGFAIGGSKVMSPKLTLTGNYYGGDEILAGSKGYRNLFDLIAVYKASDTVTYSFNTDIGIQGSTSWYGISAQARKALDEKSAVTARVEWLSDPDGALFGADSDAYGITLGYSRTVNKYLQGRVEYRHDFASGISPFASDRAGSFTDNQGSFTVSAIFSY